MYPGKRAIVVFPEFDGRLLIDRFRKQFDPLAHSIKPHLTLVFPFESSLPAEELRLHIRQAVEGVKPFPVWLQGITGSENEYLFLNVKRGNDLLIELHDRLYSGPLAAHLSREHTFGPHLTVGRVSSRPAFREALEAAQKVDQRFETVVSELTVYCLDHTDPIESRVGL